MPSRRLTGRTLRVLLWLGAALVLVYGAYLGSANWFLTSPAARRIINRHPERLNMTWTRARTWVPGLVVLDGVDIVGSNRSFDWRAQMDHALVEVSMWRLPRKIFHSEMIHGRGLVFRLRQHDRGTPEGRSASEVVSMQTPSGALPSVAPVPAEAAAQAEGETTPTVVAGGTAAASESPTAPGRGRRRPWRLDLDGIRISDLREISIGQSSLLGKGEISGGLALELGGGPLRFDVLSLAFTDSQLLRSGDAIGRNLAFTLEASSSPFRPGVDSVREILGSVSGRATVAADVESIAALGFLLKKPEWLSFAGSGHLESDVRLRRGVVAPGGRLDFVARTLEARIADWTVDGGGTIALRLPEGGPQAAIVDVDFEQFAIRRGEREVAHIRGQDLKVALTARALDLERGLEDLDLRVDVPPSRVDFAAYNSYLPKSPFRIEKGQGTLRSWFQYSEDEAAGKGEVEITVKGASGVAGGLGIDGDLKLHTLVKSGDLEARRFDVSGSSLELENVRVRKPGGKIESEGWWATFAAASAELDMKEPVEAEIAVHARMRDARPFLTALASQRKMLFWIDDLVGVRDIAGRAVVVVDGQSLQARDVAITGNHLEIEGDIRVAGPSRDGLLFIEYGPFATALELDGKEREWKLLHARRWFEERREARRHPS